MAHTANEFLAKYEIKHPDYDYVDRSYVGMSDVRHESKRYVKDGDGWKSKKTTRKLFGPKKARIMFTGDITCFEKQFEEARKGQDYDFVYQLEQVRPIFAQADLVVGNLETMIMPDAPYRTEKYVSEQNFHCNAPLEFLECVYQAGFDVVTNANNHDLDTGAVGIGETIDNVERFGLIQTGTFKREKKRFELLDVDGFKVAIVAFATEHNNKHCNLTEEGAEFLLNDYSAKKAQTILKEARAAGAELVFVCIHWGRENKTVNSPAQTAVATELAEMGYDCIIGSHPHVLQPFSIIHAGEREVPVFYSMGNFLSHNIDNQKARSVIACVDLERRGKNLSLKCSYIPIFTSKTYGPRKYVVLPLPPKPSDRRNVDRLSKIMQVVGGEIDLNREVEYKECVERTELKLPRRKDVETDLSRVKEFPVDYSDGKFTYSVWKNFAVVTGIDPACETLSYSVPAKVLGVPVTSLQSGAFAGNTIMKKINFRKSLTAIPEGLFRGCTALEGFQLGSGIRTIGEEAYAGCTALSAAVIRKGVEEIAPRAFAGCTALRSVKISASVRKIADDAFTGCSRVTIYCDEGSYAQTYAEEHGISALVMKLD